MADEVLWRRHADLPALEPHPLPERADVVIVGGGLSAARELARRGRSADLRRPHELRSGDGGADARNPPVVFVLLLPLAAASLILALRLDEQPLRTSRTPTPTEETTAL